ncbi:hypothetical protein Tco_1088527 [Tanacetum coccineum]
METQKPLLKDEDGEEVDVNMYRSMIGSLMYLTSLRPDIMFAVCACARYQVNPRVSHLYAVKRIFSDYARASLDRKSTTEGCQFLRSRLIPWQCKKQTVVVNSIIEDEYVAASSFNGGDSKLMLLGINLLLLVKVNAARHKLTTVGEGINLILLIKVNAARHNLLLLVTVNAVEESEGFEQIMDFLNANPIRYALTINPIIYISCIEQFWSTIKAKTVNGEVQLQALVDGKKIIIIESTVRKDLQLEDAEGVDCLPNPIIFEQLILMGSNTIAWNEFSSTMASAIICLATNQKFNFSKYIFESMVKNLDNVGKFLMYPRFIQVFLYKQLEGMPTYERIYIAPSHTKKIFENMRRVGKGFSGREAPLFQIMVVQAQAKMGEGSANPTDPYHTPTFIQPSTSQPQKKQKPRKPKRKDTQIPESSGPTEHVADEAVYKELDDSLVRAATTAFSLEGEQDSDGGPRRQETMGDTSAQTRVLDLEKTKTTQAKEIVSLKRRVKKLKLKKRSRTHGLKRLYKVDLIARVESSGNEESLGNDASKQERINAIDADDDITLVNDQDDAAMFDLNTLTGDEVLAEQEVATKDVNLTVNEVTLAQALAALKSVNPKVKANVVKESSAASTKVSAATTTTTATITTSRKGIVITELEPEEPLKKKDQLKLDEEMALKLQAAIDEEERLAREKDEANVALTEGWDDIQVKVDVDWYRIFTKGQKRSQNRKNRARD